MSENDDEVRLLRAENAIMANRVRQINENVRRIDDGFACSVWWEMLALFLAFAVVSLVVYFVIFLVDYNQRKGELLDCKAAMAPSAH